VLGSGLSEVAREFGGAEIPFSQIDGYPVPTVQGHRGVMMLSDTLAVMAGRFHYYEGHSMDSVVLPIFLLHSLGVRTLIVTNACGGINPEFHAGELVLIRDHLNFLGTNPLVGPNDNSLGPRFPDMTAAYTPALRKLAREAAGEDLSEGVYAAMLGPSYETPAEIGMLRAVGADMVGMSTVPEVIAASYLGMEVLGISCITNLAAGMSGDGLSHAEVVATGKQVEKTLSRLLQTVVRKILDGNG
jgi:purine-nucleoside phosphorylase